MTIVQSTDDPKLIYHGTLEVTGGRTIKFETSPAGVEIVNETVPDGETYGLEIHVIITKNGRGN